MEEGELRSIGTKSAEIEGFGVFIFFQYSCDLALRTAKEDYG
jgi:hypothetical protein